jgi:glycosyltransferase involved in cell wall biosynthesis
MLRSPCISVVVPSYNRANVVHEAVQSILAQTYRVTDVIVVDDGSTDKTLEVLAQFGDRIRVISQVNAGPAAARNSGISLATGEYVAFLDSDDVWLPTKLERQVELMEKAGENVPCCICNIQMQWPDKAAYSFDLAGLNPGPEEGLWQNVPEVLATRPVLFNQGVLIRREALRRVGGFDEELWLLEDHDLSLRLALEGNWAYIKEPLVVWRETKGSLYQESHGKEIYLNECMVRSLKRFLVFVDQRGGSHGLKARVKCELIRAHWMLSAARLRSSQRFGGAAAGAMLQVAEKSARALMRRMPWFPGMKCSGID